MRLYGSYTIPIFIPVKILVIYLFCGMNECNIDFVGVDIDDTIEIAIVSDDDGDYDVKTWAMTTAYKIC